MAENFVRNLSERIKLNIEYYILHGHIPFKPLYGYVKKGFTLAAMRYNQLSYLHICSVNYWDYQFV